MKGKRRNHNAQFKAKVALAAVIVSIVAISRFSAKSQLGSIHHKLLYIGANIVLVQRELDKSTSPLRDYPAFGRKVF